MVFLNLGKAYDRVPREFLKWALIRKEIPKIYIIVVEDMYEGVCISIKSMFGAFRVKLSIHKDQL